MKLLAFAGSNSRKSINKQLVEHTLQQMPMFEHTLIDLNDYEMPLFSVDREAVIGQHQLAKDFLEIIGRHDAIVCSMAENNRNFSVAFKNILDWCSRIQLKVFQEKPTLLMSTSPGVAGGASVMNISKTFLPRFGMHIVANYSLPSFNANFTPGEGITNSEQKELHAQTVQKMIGYLQGLKDQ